MCAHWRPFSWWRPRPPPSSPMPGNGTVGYIEMGLVKQCISIFSFLRLVKILTSFYRIKQPIYVIRCYLYVITHFLLFHIFSSLFDPYYSISYNSRRLTPPSKLAMNSTSYKNNQNFQLKIKKINSRLPSKESQHIDP